MRRWLWTFLLFLAVTPCFAGPEVMFAATKLANTISLTTPNNMTVGDADQSITCSATSGTACMVTSNTTSYCTIVSGKLHAVAAGTCTISANNAASGRYVVAAQVNSGNVTISAGAGNTTWFGSSLVVSGGSLIETPTGGIDYQGIGPGTMWNYENTVVYTAPGSGTKHTVDCVVYAKSHGGTPGNVRMAVYTSSSGDLGTLKAQGNAEHVVSSTTPSYIHMTTMTESGTLTGGSQYLIAVTTDSADTQIYYSDVADSVVEKGTEYTGGFSNDIAGDSLAGYNLAIACGVQ